MKRVLYIDIIKIVACFMVIINHTTSRLFITSSPSPSWYISLTYFFASKPAVSLFLMASGAMLLGKQDSYKKNWNRIGKTVLIVFIFSLFYRITFFDFTSLPVFIKKFIAGPQTGAFWYMYLYIGILFMLPILQKLCSNLKKRDYYYLIGITVLFMGAIPLVNHYFPSININNDFTLPIFSVYTGVYISGYFIHTYLTPNKKSVTIAIILLLLILALQIFGIYNQYDTEGNDIISFFDNRTMILITSSSMLIFYIAKYLFNDTHFSDKFSKIISYISSCTFGIYLVSDYLIYKLEFVFNYFTSSIHPLISVLIYQISVFAIGLIIISLFKKIPYLKKII